jgi:hypothetical protein
MTMPGTSITTNLNKAFNIKVNRFSKLTLNPVLPVNKLTETINLFFGEAVRLSIRIDTSLG